MDRAEQATNLRKRGHTTSEIAEMMGITEDTVRCHLAAVSRRGKRVTAATTMNLMKAMPKEIAEWVRVVTPEGASFAETIIAIVTDAYNEEMERQKPLKKQQPRSK